MSVSTVIDHSSQPHTFQRWPSAGQWRTGDQQYRDDQRPPDDQGKPDARPRPHDDALFNDQVPAGDQPPALFRRSIAVVTLQPPVSGDRVADNEAAHHQSSNSGPTRTSSRGSEIGSDQRSTRTVRGRSPRTPSAPPVPQAAKDLLSDATRGLGQAMAATAVADRYATAHLAALRAAAAVLAARARPVRGRRGSAWELISKVAPEFAEWAAFFAAGSAKRQAAEAGINRLVSPREADDMIRQVAAFIELVEDALTNGSTPRREMGVERRAL